MDKDLLKKGIQVFGLSVADEQANSFELLFEEINKWGNKINLTALLNNEERLIEELFIDSLSPLLFIEKLKLESAFLLDIGSGGGFPGLPLQIIRPSLHVTLSDSIEKKIFFIKNIIRKLDLPHTKAVCMRFGSQSATPLHPESFDLVTSKAVTDIDELGLWSLPYLKKGAYLICLKTPLTSYERLDGFDEPEEINYTLPFSNIKRKLIVFKKR